MESLCEKTKKCESEVLTLLDVVKTTSGRAFFVCGNFTSLSGLFNCGDCYVQSSVICYGWMRNTHNRKDTGAFRMKSITEM